MSNMQQALLLFTENQKVLFSTFSYDRFTLIYKQKQISSIKLNQRGPPEPRRVMGNLEKVHFSVTVVLFNMKMQSTSIPMNSRG